MLAHEEAVLHTPIPLRTPIPPMFPAFAGVRLGCTGLRIAVSCVLALGPALAGCGDSARREGRDGAIGLDAGGADGAVRPDAGVPDGDVDPADARVAVDARPPPECPAAATPGGECDSVGLACRHGDSVCTCEVVCSGVDPGPDPATFWACVNRPPTCPVSPPMDGAPCSHPETCQWGSCGGVVATCANAGGAWSVETFPPPP